MVFITTYQTTNSIVEMLCDSNVTNYEWYDINANYQNIDFLDDLLKKYSMGTKRLKIYIDGLLLQCHFEQSDRVWVD